MEGRRFGRVVHPECPHTHTPEEAAALIGGVSPRTLRDRAGRKEIPSIKVGTKVQFTDAQIETIIGMYQRGAAPPRPDSRRHS